MHQHDTQLISWGLLYGRFPQMFHMLTHVILPTCKTHVHMFLQDQPTCLSVSVYSCCSVFCSGLFLISLGLTCSVCRSLIPGWWGWGRDCSGLRSPAESRPHPKTEESQLWTFFCGVKVNRGRKEAVGPDWELLKEAGMKEKTCQTSRPCGDQPGGAPKKSQLNLFWF